jgi:FkbM family methyltransferase
MKSDPLFALTSLSPSPDRAGIQRQCLESWHKSGLQIRSFNHPSEIESLRSFPHVEFIAVESAGLEGTPARPYVPIKAMLNWSAAQNAAVLIINSDIELRLEPWQLKRARWCANDGLCYFVRYNHDGDIACAQREPYGIDAFMLHGGNAGLFPDSSLSMGQPFWDYWIPYVFSQASCDIYSAESPVAFHRTHPQRWSWESWHRCALEFDRMAGLLHRDKSVEACVAMAARVRAGFDQHRKILSPQPLEIRQWVTKTFSTTRPKTFLELGAHTGSDTAWMASLPGVTIHAFEPDPRNLPPSMPNVTVHRAAVTDHDGSAPFIMSAWGWGRPWTHSSSLKMPKKHLERYPVTFGDVIEVKTLALDTFCRDRIGVVDFIWADIQGAEVEMIRGARETLARTRYLYTEYSDDELYLNQGSLRDILDLLPDFRVVELWSDDVLLENRKLANAGN